MTKRELIEELRGKLRDFLAHPPSKCWCCEKMLWTDQAEYQTIHGFCIHDWRFREKGEAYYRRKLAALEAEVSDE